MMYISTSISVNCTLGSSTGFASEKIDSSNVCVGGGVEGSGGGVFIRGGREEGGILENI